MPPTRTHALLRRDPLQRQGSAAVAVPAVERVPCDLLAWGSAQRAPPAPSLRSVMGVGDDCWQRRAAPALAPGGGHLDAYRGAVGRKHGAVITATGALYTWGEGRGGKLGLGHDQDQSVPQRVRHGLEGQCMVAVACGDDCTAALTDGGELYMWGRLHAVARPQLVPLHVRGELRGRHVVQASLWKEVFRRVGQQLGWQAASLQSMGETAYPYISFPPKLSCTCFRPFPLLPLLTTADLVRPLPLRGPHRRGAALHLGGGLWRQAGARRPGQPR